ncbi:hypothetical protein [Myxococcus sp. SDU36]|nr:hypothetical protein [Myxococcus sp. SDU36]WIG97273.1 hypothetical protein KGD87_07755 [Myxococcus sp. SDU36]
MRRFTSPWRRSSPLVLLVAYLMPTGHVAAYSVPLVGGAFIWGGKVYR